jgi:hypothetical protein
MRNDEKVELRRIIKSIPTAEIASQTASALWKEYGSDFAYATFKNYLRALRGDELSPQADSGSTSEGGIIEK